jgi:hypothetical protein
VLAGPRSEADPTPNLRGLRGPGAASRGELAYLAVQTLVFAASALTGSGPAMGNWIFALVSAVLFAVFAAVWAARPK